MLTAVGLASVVALILANGYFVLGEFAYVAANRSQIERAALAGDRRAVVALGILRRLSFMLSGAQLGITVTSLVVGYIAEPVFARLLSPVLSVLGVPEEATFGIALTTGLVLSTSTQMVVGELGPKNLGIAQPERFALMVARSTRLFLILAGPLITLFDTSANRLLRALGIEPVEELQAGVSAEELELIVAASGQEGLLSDRQTSLLARVLDFRGLRASEAMVPRPQVVTLAADATCADLEALATATGHSRFPLVGEGLDDVLGVVHVKDVLRIRPDARHATPARQLATAPPPVPESAQLAPLLLALRQARASMAVVIDEYGGVAGIITLEDIVEELLGSIHDEHDREEPGVQRQQDGSWVGPGSLRPDEVERETGLAVPEGEYETLSGLVMERLGRVPNPGDSVTLPGLRLTVESLAGLAVGRVRLTPVDDDEAEAGP